MSEITTNKKPIYKKWWFIAGAAIVIIAAIASGGGGKSGNTKGDSQITETKAKVIKTSITGNWYNTGNYGENKLQILSPDNFIYTNPLGESLFGKWSKVYGDTYSLTYDDGSEAEAILNGDVLDYLGADWNKR
jgi:hypothetical protein